MRTLLHTQVCTELRTMVRNLQVKTCGAHLVDHHSGAHRTVVRHPPAGAPALTCTQVRTAPRCQTMVRPTQVRIPVRISLRTTKVCTEVRTVVRTPEVRTQVCTQSCTAQVRNELRTVLRTP